MMRALALLALLAGASAVELSHYNFKESVQGEKSAFIKFLAPWQAPPHPTPLLRPCPAGTDTRAPYLNIAPSAG